jgi:hypothetical protein
MASLKGQNGHDMHEDSQRVLDQNNYPWSHARFMRVLDKGTRRTVVTPEKGEVTLIYFGGMEVSASLITNPDLHVVCHKLKLAHGSDALVLNLPTCHFTHTQHHLEYC